MDSAPADAARTRGPAIFTLAAFKRGLREGIPFAPGIFAFGIVFGVVGRAFPPAKRTIALGVVSSAGAFALR